MQSMNWEESRLATKPNDPEYYSHALFTSLERYMEFYEQLSDLIMGFTTNRVEKLFMNLDTYLYMSIRGTLDSIRMTVHEGHVNDGHALVRKYYDLVILSLYLDLYLNDSSDEDADAMNRIENWLSGKERLPDFEHMKRQLKSSKRLEPIFRKLLETDGRYKTIRDRSNNHMHHNFFQYILLNNRDRYIDRKHSLDLLNDDVTDIFVLHLTCVFFTNEHYMRSSDYIDHLECGMTPNPDSIYWVAPFVQTIYDEVLNKRRPDVCAIIQQNTSMNLCC